MLQATDLEVARLGTPRFVSPLAHRPDGEKSRVQFVSDLRRVLFQHEIDPAVGCVDRLSFEKAGPRERLFFDPAQTAAAIVTCGGLCPGLNNVIRSVFIELCSNYGVHRVLGIRDGYQGLNPQLGQTPLELAPDTVESIHKLGGTILGSSRGPQDVAVIVDFLEQTGIDVLFCVGGDGTQRGAHAIHQEIARRGLPKSVVGIPKTIDNDIRFVQQTFGYSTALARAEEALRAAHVEARGAPNGIGLVKLMGRHAGFIAAGATLASQEVNFVLVPEVAFPLDGPHGLLVALEYRMRCRGHALIAVAEGAGQHLLDAESTRCDASGNVANEDIGTFLRSRIIAHFDQCGIPANVKYIDPSYLLRGVPANTQDCVLSDQMARHAVHAAMAGKTDMLVGFWDSALIHVPIATAVAQRKQLDTSGDIWTAVLGATGQPHW